MALLLFALGAAGFVLSLVYVFARVAARSRSHAWRQAATAVGLKDLVSSGYLGFERGITGRWGTLRVSLERYDGGASGGGNRIVVEGLGHRSPELRACREGMGSAIDKAFGVREIELGDAEFDQRVYIHGSPVVVRALFDSESRRLLGELIDGRIPTDDGYPPLKGDVRVSGGTLQAEIPEPPLMPGGVRLPEALATLLAAARRLVLPEDLPARLAHNARADPLPGVRLANLLTLLREYRDHEATKETLLTACSDDDDEVRLRAALALGDLGREVLLEIASSPGVTDDRSARALTALGEHLGGTEATEILESALPSGRVATATAAAQALGRIGGPDAVEALSRALLAEDEGLATTAAAALGATGEAAAEGALLAGLDRAVPAVWPAIARALGQAGTAAAVAPLQDLAGRLSFDLSLHRASRQAIAEIQARLGASRGQLALAEGNSGRLALAEAGLEGRVAVAAESEPPRKDEGDVGDGTQWPTDATGDGAREAADSPSDGGTPRPREPEEG